MTRPTRWRSRHPCSPARPGEQGTGLFGSMMAILVFLAFLFFAVQLLSNLYATSVVTANGFDAARTVAAATAEGGCGRDAMAAAEADVRARMGDAGERLHFDWSGSDDDVVRLHLTAENRRLALFGSAPLPFTRIDRTIEVRVERFR